MLHSCVVMVRTTNLYTSYLIQIDTNIYRSVGKKYRLPSNKCGRSVTLTVCSSLALQLVSRTAAVQIEGVHVAGRYVSVSVSILRLLMSL